MLSTARAALAAATILLASTASSAFEATITEIAPVAAHPVGAVSKNELAPVDGVPVSPPRAPAAPYSYSSSNVPTRTKIPVPTTNPAAVSWCLSDIH
jgi:hypothetical protein